MSVEGNGMDTKGTYAVIVRRYASLMETPLSDYRQDTGLIAQVIETDYARATLTASLMYRKYRKEFGVGFGMVSVWRENPNGLRTIIGEMVGTKYRAIWAD